MLKSGTCQAAPIISADSRPVPYSGAREVRTDTSAKDKIGWLYHYRSVTGHVCRCHRQTMPYPCPARCSVSLGISAPRYTPSSSLSGTASLRASALLHLISHKHRTKQPVYPVYATKPLLCPPFPSTLRNVGLHLSKLTSFSLQSVETQLFGHDSRRNEHQQLTTLTDIAFVLEQPSEERDIA